VVFHEQLGEDHQRNVTIFADGQVDRSPCGSGTSARLATLAERGELTLHQPFRHDSIVGTTFDAQLTGMRTVDGRRLWDTEVVGRSSRTGEHTFVLEDDDEVGLGFVLR
jgi:proline racemase